MEGESPKRKKNKKRRENVKFTLKDVQGLCVIAKESQGSYADLEVFAEYEGLARGKDYVDQQSLCAKLLQLFDTVTFLNIPTLVIAEIASKMDPPRLFTFMNTTFAVRRAIIEFREKIKRAVFAPKGNVSTFWDMSRYWEMGIDSYLVYGTTRIVHALLDLGYPDPMAQVKLTSVFYPINAVEAALVRPVYAKGDYKLLDLLILHGLNLVEYKVPGMCFFFLGKTQPD